MESIDAANALGSLAQVTRLEVFRLLVRHEPDGLAAGDIARQLGVPANTLSTHLRLENRVLKEERDILKKATQFFASQRP